MINDIKMFQFDLLSFTVDIVTADGSPYELKEGESLWYRVKTDPSSAPLIEVNQTDTTFNFYEVTLPCGTYLQEVGIIFEDGRELTLIQSTLTILRRLKAQ